MQLGSHGCCLGDDILCDVLCVQTVDKIIHILHGHDDVLILLNRTSFKNGCTCRIGRTQISECGVKHSFSNRRRGLCLAKGKFSFGLKSMLLTYFCILFDECISQVSFTNSPLHFQK